MTSSVNAVTSPAGSSDGKFYSGMTQKEVYTDKELLDLFTFADKNNDKVIDDAEIERYNGPILLENVETKTGRFIGNYNGYGRFGSHSGETSGSIISENEIEYYPGLKAEDMDVNASIHTFRNLDCDADGELTKEELENYKDFAAYKQEFDKLEKKKADIGLEALSGATLGGAAGLVTAEIAYIASGAAIFGPAIVIGMVGTAICGAICARCKNNNTEEKQHALTEEFKQKEASKYDFEYNSAITVG